MKAPTCRLCGAELAPFAEAVAALEDRAVRIVRATRALPADVELERLAVDELVRIIAQHAARARGCCPNHRPDELACAALRKLSPPPGRPRSSPLPFSRIGGAG